MGKNGLDNINIEAYKVAVQEAKDIVDKAIKADKNFISEFSLIYDEDLDKTIIQEPNKNCLILRMTLKHTQAHFTTNIYALSSTLVNGSSEEVGGTTYIPSIGPVDYLSGDYETNYEIISIMYLPTTSLQKAMFKNNSYYILNPITNTGTKLYKHSIQISYTEEGNSYIINLNVITNSVNQFEATTSGGPPRFSSSGDIISFVSSVEHIFGTYYDNKSIGRYYSFTNNTLVQHEIASGTLISDTVTEL